MGRQGDGEMGRGGDGEMGRGGDGEMGRWGDKEMGRQGEITPNYSLLPTPYSLLPTPYSLLPTPYSLLPTPYSLLPTPYSSLNLLEILNRLTRIVAVYSNPEFPNRDRFLLHRYLQSLSQFADGNNRHS